MFSFAYKLQLVDIIWKAAANGSCGKQLVSNVFSCSSEGLPEGQCFKQAEATMQKSQQNRNKAGRWFINFVWN